MGGEGGHECNVHKDYIPGTERGKETKREKLIGDRGQIETQQGVKKESR